MTSNAERADVLARALRASISGESGTARACYTDDVKGSSTATDPGLGLPGVTETGKYDVEVTDLGEGGQTYEASATPHTGGGQTDDKDCGTFTINERGVRGNSTGADHVQLCWK